MSPSDYGVCGSIIEDAQVETGWDDQSLWVILLGFLEDERKRDQDVVGRFSGYIEACVAEERGEEDHAAEEDSDGDCDEDGLEL